MNGCSPWQCVIPASLTWQALLCFHQLVWCWWLEVFWISRKQPRKFPPGRSDFASSFLPWMFLKLSFLDSYLKIAVRFSPCVWKSADEKTPRQRHWEAFVTFEKFHRCGLWKQYFSWTVRRISPLCAVPVGFTQQLVCCRCNEKLCKRQWMRKLIGERRNNIVTYPEAPMSSLGALYLDHRATF